MIVSFDFDNTLTKTQWNPDDGWFTTDAGPNTRMLALLKDHLQLGNEVHIVTTRNKDKMKEVTEFLVTHGVHDDITGIHNTSGQLKVSKLTEIGVHRHFDDDHEELLNLPRGCSGVLVASGWIDETGSTTNPSDPKWHASQWQSMEGEIPV